MLVTLINPSDSHNKRQSNWLTLAVRLTGRSCLVVGGGDTALKRARKLIQAGARPTIVAPGILPSILELDVKCVQRKFRKQDLNAIELVVVATDDRELNQRVCQLALRQRIWVNATHDADEGDLIFPSSFQRGELQIAVSTGGRAPVLSRYLTQELESRFPKRWSEVVRFMAKWRDRVKEQLPDNRRLVQFWQRFLRLDPVENILRGQSDQAEYILKESLLTLKNRQTPNQLACVYLVGAGPGDPRLLTLHAYQVIQSADIILYDRLVSEEVLALAPAHIEKVNVGKERQRRLMRQESINKRMIEYARQGRRVVRLKGGDPFIFGRGGEELAELSRSEVPFYVIPGISAANGCGCYHGIPLTHRDYAHSCLLMTAHRQQGAPEIDWLSLNRPKQTIVLYMGNYRIVEVAKQLIAHGFSGDHPLAVISNGTTPSEKIWIGGLDEVIECGVKLPSPALVILGEVVRLHDSLRRRSRNPLVNAINHPEDSNSTE